MSVHTVHSQAQCQAKWQRRCRAFQHSCGIEPMSPNSLQLTSTTKPLVCTNFRVLEKQYMTRCISPPATNFFPYRIVVLGSFKLNIKAGHEVREFLNAKPLIDTSYDSYRNRSELKIFTCLMLNDIAHRAAH